MVIMISITSVIMDTMVCTTLVTMDSIMDFITLDITSNFVSQQKMICFLSWLLNESLPFLLKSQTTLSRNDKSITVKHLLSFTLFHSCKHVLFDITLHYIIFLILCPASAFVSKFRWGWWMTVNFSFKTIVLSPSSSLTIIVKKLHLFCCHFFLIWPLLLNLVKEQEKYTKKLKIFRILEN